MSDLETIIKYYDRTTSVYEKYWYGDSESYALHYGFWEKDTKTFSESLINTNKFLAEKLKIKSSDTILDAGCGVGGSTIWIAKNFQAKVTGITISETQVHQAAKLAKLNKVEQLVDFKVRNFLDTKFPDESFDIIWAIESVCHAQKKEEFLKEAFRLLRKGGKIIIADAFQQREFQNASEEEMVRIFNEGLALPNIAKINDFKEYMNRVGFENIQFYNKTEAILNSSRRMYNLCRFIYPLQRIIKIFKQNSQGLKILQKNNRAGILQYKLIKSGLAGYGVFYGEKTF